MLNKNTRTILSQLSAINNSMIISYPVTCVKEGRTIQAFLDVTKLDEEPFEEIGFFNIGEFNSIVNLVDDQVITNDNGMLTIKNKDTSIKYGSSKLSGIEDICRGDSDLLTRVKTNDKVMSFTLDTAVLDKIKKMSNLLKNLTDLEIKSENGVISVELKGVEKSSANLIVNCDGTSEGDNTITLLMKAVTKLPSSSFEVEVRKSSKGTLVALFNSINVEGLTVLIARKAT